MSRWIWVGVLGMLGVYSRYFASLWINRILPTPFPVGTLTINCVGAFLIGLIFVWGTERGLLSESLRIGITVGFLGGLTTFSSFCLDAIGALERGHIIQTVTYVFLSNILGLAATYAGMSLARS